MITDKQKKWIIAHFKNTKNDDIMQKTGIKHSALHRFAAENGLKKTKQFQSKCQANATKAAWIANRKNGYPPKGFVIPKSAENRFKIGETNLERLGAKRERERIQKSTTARRATVASEKRRVLFGLPQKTKLKVIKAPHVKSSYRHLLKKRGYIVYRGCREFFYTEKTIRSEISEKRASEKHRFEFKPYTAIIN